MGLVDKAIERLRRVNKKELDGSELYRELSFIRLDKNEIKRLINDLKFFEHIYFDKKKKKYRVLIFK